MMKCITLRKKKGVYVLTQQMMDEVENDLQEINGVNTAIFDKQTLRVDVYMEEGTEIELSELFRAVTRSGNFVLGGFS